MNQHRIEQLKQMLQESPEDPFLLYALAMEHNNAQNHELALQFYETLVSKHRHYVGTYYHLAKLYEQLKMNEKAKACYENGMGIARQMGDHHAYNELNAAFKSFMGVEPDDEDF
jgi:uncharacterized protein HemY